MSVEEHVKHKRWNIWIDTHNTVVRKAESIDIARIQKLLSLLYYASERTTNDKWLENRENENRSKSYLVRNCICNKSGSDHGKYYSECREHYTWNRCVTCAVSCERNISKIELMETIDKSTLWRSEWKWTIEKYLYNNLDIDNKNRRYYRTHNTPSLHKIVAEYRKIWSYHKHESCIK